MRKWDKTRTVKPKGRPILCLYCGKGGGTLRKIGDREYAHDGCSPEGVVMAKESKVVLPTRKEVEQFGKGG